MTSIERQVKHAQRRLWFNRWFGILGWSLTLVTTIWILIWIADRLFSLKWPMGTLALAALGVGLLASLIWLIRTRDNPLAAATALDAAAGLRERVSTSLDIHADSKDPFETAVVSDAERIVAGLTPRKFLPLRWAGSLSISGIVLIVALLSLLIPELDLLGRDQASSEARAQAARVARTRAAVAKPISALKEIAKKNPDLDMKDDLNRLDNPLDDRNNADPDVVRRQTLKQLNRLRDALQKKAGADRFQTLKETRKRLRQIGEPSDPKSELRELMSSLSAGDFQSAQKEIKKIQEKLAQRAGDGKSNPEETKKLQAQLKELSNKLKQSAQDKQAQRQLQNAGLSKEEAKRVLKALSRKDPEQIKKMAKELAKRLKNKGITSKQMEKMLKKMQQQQKACKQCNKMGEKMGKAAKAMSKGDMKQAQKQLDEAGEKLGEMEQMEQALSQLESQLDQLEDTADDLEEYDPEDDDLACKQCDGSGFLPDGSPCPNCNRNNQGNGPGGRGRGAGKRDRDDSAKTSTVNKRTQVRRGRGGSIIGQTYVKGKQLKGESRVEFKDAAGAAEIDATDTLNRDRSPRAYRGSIKRFFDRLGDDFDANKDSKPQESDKKLKPSPSADK